jgi:phospholipid/cholesterol/gamma-HCH transport system permease protein
MLGLAQTLGSQAIRLVVSSGQVILLAWDAFCCLFRYPIRWNLLFRQLFFVGARSQLVVFVTGAFTGAVLAAQIKFKFDSLGLN